VNILTWCSQLPNEAIPGNDGGSLEIQTHETCQGVTIEAERYIQFMNDHSIHRKFSIHNQLQYNVPNIHVQLRLPLHLLPNLLSM
jgi:hypothetical protein